MTFDLNEFKLRHFSHSIFSFFSIAMVAKNYFRAVGLGLLLTILLKEATGTSKCLSLHGGKSPLNQKAQ